MKRYSSILLAAILFILPDMGIATEENHCELAHHAPEISYLVASDNGVFLQVGTSWIFSEGLLASAEGIFVLVRGEYIPLESALEDCECVRKTWKCSRCGFVNYEDISACAVCGKPRYER